MWLTNSSIGRKYVMALTGACLVLFVTFHVLMNAVCIFWPVAYNVICEFLGANWYALIASCGLALLFIIHIIYASWLTIQNRKARGHERYAVNRKPKQVEWSSKNMYILGIVILAFLVVHIIQFWSKMQWAEIIGNYHVDELAGKSVAVPPAAGTWMIELAFSQIATPIIYIIGFVALWFHMNHGIWSMFQTAGWNNQVWLPRLKKIGCWWTTIVVGLFIAQAVVFTVLAHRHYYTQNPVLLEQYANMYETDHNAGFAAPAVGECCDGAGEAVLDCCAEDAAVLDCCAAEGVCEAAEICQKDAETILADCCNEADVPQTVNAND